jgi:hypothetical protein
MTSTMVIYTHIRLRYYTLLCNCCRSVTGSAWPSFFSAEDDGFNFISTIYSYIHILYALTLIHIAVSLLVISSPSPLYLGDWDNSFVDLSGPSCDSSDTFVLFVCLYEQLSVSLLLLNLINYVRRLSFMQWSRR